MSVHELIWRSLKKNLKNYYLYVFALIFSVALYFAFVTLQYDPSMDQVKGSIKGGASIRAASILLVAIVTIFLLYANNIFIKRRGKEIGLFQLIGMTKSRIFFILNTENALLYFGSLIVGVFIGFSFSKLIMLILFDITGTNDVATLQFSSQAFIQTVLVFLAIYLFIMLVNYFFIKRQGILSLFRALSATETKVKKMSIFEMIIGILGIVMIITGYYISSKLFSGEYSTMTELFTAMIIILASVIIGTYLFYKGSVSFIFNLIRKKKDGYLTINEVLSLSSIMFRMKSNALLLTVITTVSALAIALLSLSYISYYSAEKTAESYVPADFALANDKDANTFTEALHQNGILYDEQKIEVLQANIDVENILDTDMEIEFDPKQMAMPVVSEKAIGGVNLSPNEVYFSGYNDMLQRMMDFKDSGTIEIKGKQEKIKQTYTGLKKDFIVSWYFTNGGIPVVVVDDSVFQRLKKDIDPSIQKESTQYIGVDIKDDDQLERANELFLKVLPNEDYLNDSRLETSNSQKKNMGLIMFIVGFLGLTFLITSGCILYFKQMGEGEDEKPGYTILRKLGFTQGDLLKGIQVKQFFNFGIPLITGLFHSYFAVQSGWFLFGSELWTPMIIVMLLYTVLYSIFGILSVLYYKKVIKESL